MKLGMMVVFVSDLEQAKRFYCDTLGFPLKAEHANFIEFEHDGCEFKAFKCDENQPVNNYSMGCSVSLCVQGKFGRRVVSRAEGRVKFLHTQPAQNEFSRYVAFTDPFGNVHELYESKG